MLVSIVIPMKDEEGSLPRLAEELGELEELLAARADELEVILVDDASTDGTAETARRLCAAGPRRRLLTHAENRGFGAGLRTGTQASTGAVVVSYDADCAYPAADVVRLLEALDAGADIATATPFAEGAENRAGPIRLLLSHGCSFAYRLVLRGKARGIRTFTCAFRAYRGDLLRDLRWEADRFLAAAEILSRALLGGARVVEVASVLRPRFAGASKMRVFRNVLAHLGLLGRLAIRGAH